MYIIWHQHIIAYFVKSLVLAHFTIHQITNKKFSTWTDTGLMIISFGHTGNSYFNLLYNILAMTGSWNESHTALSTVLLISKLVDPLAFFSSSLQAYSYTFIWWIEYIQPIILGILLSLINFLLLHFFGTVLHV